MRALYELSVYIMLFLAGWFAHKATYALKRSASNEPTAPKESK